MSTKKMVTCAIFAAILCVFSVITIPIGPVPISLSLLGIMLAAVILGPKEGTVSVAVFVLLGAVGLPVFSGFKGGLGVLMGPTGGYIWSYVPVALLIGFFSRREYNNKWLTMIRIFIVCVIGVAICYLAGTAQFVFVRQVSIKEALAMCVIPFIPFDAAKSALASYVGYKVKKAMVKDKNNG